MLQSSYMNTSFFGSKLVVKINYYNVAVISSGFAKHDLHV